MSRTNAYSALLAYWKGQGLSRYASNALARKQVSSWAGLQQFTLQEIEDFPGIGNETAAEIRAAAESLGYVLVDNPPPKGESFLVKKGRPGTRKKN